MKKGCSIALGIFVVLIAGFFWILWSAFQPDEYTVELKQNISGKLICDITHIMDHHSWTYHIEYKYQDGDDSIQTIGYGSYNGRKWAKKEQLLRYGEWTILQTGNHYDTDKILIGKLSSKKWSEYAFTPDSIEKDNLWINQNIHSLLGWSPSEALIQKVDNGVVSVIYRYLVDEKDAEKTAARLIYYKVDDSTGEPKMIRFERVGKNFSQTKKAPHL